MAYDFHTTMNHDHKAGRHAGTKARDAEGRRGFSLVELLIALAITAALLTAVMVSLNTSFMAYQATTEVASTHTISRLAMQRILALVRTGHDFGPYPTNPLDTDLASDFIEFATPSGQVLTIQWVEEADAGAGFSDGEALYVIVTDPYTSIQTPYKLLEGVKAQYRPLNDPDDPGGRIKPFALQYQKGRHLYRATIDLTVVPDDNMSVALDGRNTDVIRLVASAMPRAQMY
jgi:prepilin-type N-terminal cleavage/methylation domain-containing protein